MGNLKGVEREIERRGKRGERTEGKKEEKVEGEKRRRKSGGEGITL